jgi:hypothetical protein
VSGGEDKQAPSLTETDIKLTDCHEKIMASDQRTTGHICCANAQVDLHGTEETDEHMKKAPRSQRSGLPRVGLFLIHVYSSGGREA